MRLAVLARCELDFGGRAAVAVDLADRSLADGRLLREHLAVSALPFLALGTLTGLGSSSAPSATTTTRSLCRGRGT